jgi:hypothetical protein
MKESHIEGGRFRKDQLVRYFGIALLLGALAHEIFDRYSVPEDITSSSSSSSDRNDELQKVGPRLSK